MSSLRVYGGVPLNGDVKISGARNSVLKLIHAALFSNQDIILHNVPRIGSLLKDIELLESIGAKFDWLSANILRVNCSGIHTYEIPQNPEHSPRTLLLLAGPLVFRFGKVILPIPKSQVWGVRPINRFITTWESLGYKVEQTETHLHISGTNQVGGNVSFKKSSHMGTENAIISSLFFEGDTYIKNAAEEVEIEDLIQFCNLLGASVERIEPRVIKVTGTSVFKGFDFTVQPDKTDVVFYSLAAILTKGNIIIHNVNRSQLLSFISVLNRVGCKYEFHGSQLRAWYSGEDFQATDIITTPAPGILTEWHPLLAVLLSQASGNSMIYDTIYTDRFSYIKDLNILGAKIQLATPASVGQELQINDDSYDIKVSGEPKNVALISGPTKLKGSKLIISEMMSGAALLLAALISEGKSEISGISHLASGFDSLLENLQGLGAQIEIIDEEFSI